MIPFLIEIVELATAALVLGLAMPLLKNTSKFGDPNLCPMVTHAVSRVRETGGVTA